MLVNIIINNIEKNLKLALFLIIKPNKKRPVFFFNLFPYLDEYRAISKLQDPMFKLIRFH